MLEQCICKNVCQSKVKIYNACMNLDERLRKWKVGRKCWSFGPHLYSILIS